MLFNAILIQDKGGMLDCNLSSADRWFGYPRSEVLGPTGRSW